MKVAFDFDGTIADTMPELEDLAAGLITRKLDIRDDQARELYRMTAGFPFDRQLDAIAVSLDISRNKLNMIERDFSLRKRSITLNANPFSDVAPAIQMLRHAGAEIHLVSSSTTTLVHQWAHRTAERAGWFDFIGGISYGGFETKEKQLLQNEPDVFIGDTDNDAKIAASIGTTFIGIRRDSRYMTLPSALDDLLQLEIFIR